ncbi:hypothetical protein EX30DRAFT_297924, partial [Ascodesmis nigricans]
LLHFDHQHLTPERLETFTRAINAKMIPLRTCWGFLDGTVRPIARPVRRQRTYYNGWKRIHVLKYQAVVTPDGLIVHFYEPLEGRRHDIHVYRESGLQQILEQYSFDRSGTPLVLYGDAGY